MRQDLLLLEFFNAIINDDRARVISCLQNPLVVWSPSGIKDGITLAFNIGNYRMIIFILDTIDEDIATYVIPKVINMILKIIVF